MSSRCSHSSYCCIYSFASIGWHLAELKSLIVHFVAFFDPETTANERLAAVEQRLRLYYLKQRKGKQHLHLLTFLTFIFFGCSNHLNIAPNISKFPQIYKYMYRDHVNTKNHTPRQNCPGITCCPGLM